MKVKNYFSKKYLGYEMFIYEGENRCSLDVNFFIEKGHTIYKGIMSKEERLAVDTLITAYGKLEIDDMDIDNYNKQIFIYVN